MTEFSDHENYNCRITLKSGDSYQINANWLRNEGLDRWRNWHCKAGVTRLLIADDQVYSGECRNQHLGTIDNWKLEETFTICNRESCTGCADDLMVEKHEFIPSQSSEETRDPS